MNEDRNEVTFEVPGEPVAKGRPRFVKTGSSTRAVTPAKTRNYEAWVKDCYCTQVGTSTLLHGPIEAEIIACFRIPESGSRRKRQAMLEGELRPMKKPDGDNITKIILDSLNGIAYGDDKEIVSLHCTKIYSDRPRVEVTLREL